MSTEPDRASAKGEILARDSKDAELDATLAKAKHDEAALAVLAQNNQHSIAMAKINLGKVGGYVGSGPEKAGNIAYVVIVAAFILLGASLALTGYVQSRELISALDKLITGAIALVSGALGYLFGKDPPK